MYESLQQFLYNFIFNNIIEWSELILFTIFLIIGYCLTPTSAKLAIKSIFNKIFIILTFVFIIYISIILLLLGRVDFYNYFNFVDVLSLVCYDYSIHIFNSYKLSYDYNIFKEMIKEAFESLILTYFLKIFINIFKCNLIGENDIFNTIFSDITLIIFMALIIFPFMYIIAVVNEYYEIYTLINSLKYSISLLDIFKKCKMSIQSIYEFKNRILICDDYLINNFHEYCDQEMYKFKNNFIYQYDKKIGNYEYLESIPECDGENIIEAFTIPHKLPYVVDYTNDDDYCNVFYIEFNNKFLKIYLNSKKCYPLRDKHILIEYIFKNNIVL